LHNRCKCFYEPKRLLQIDAATYYYQIICQPKGERKGKIGIGFRGTDMGSCFEIRIPTREILELVHADLIVD
jgi:hypothetical protein